VLGGGFNSDHTGRFWESVFRSAADRAAGSPKQWFRPRFLDHKDSRFSAAAWQSTTALQPVDAAGNVLYANLWAAGGLLAHMDPILERSLEGVAIATGVAAAEQKFSFTWLRRRREQNLEQPTWGGHRSRCSLSQPEASLDGNIGIGQSVIPGKIALLTRRGDDECS
jgi:hypothetical protein